MDTTVSGNYHEREIGKRDKRIAELEQLLAVRPQDECTERLTVQPDGSLRCHRCGHVVPTSTKSD